MEKDFETIELDGIKVETVAFDQTKADANIAEFNFDESEANSDGKGEE